ncbi:nucleotidyltransferase domain-containing protein [Thermodesulfovibrionales bacterium]|nr:nucleotidyltransferase domain-containing protein [Thermodesulfovibrionales bacterium]MCL0061807.1 nucleotidyltransferase domain-containing protein [Thermodesulfovibrionales bacterium]MCL0082961.1 nucleotidyltransferase domain-containing protein [Thermodesulfovibrionales bacterium]
MDLKLKSGCLDTEIIREIVERIVAVSNPQRIILFGSFAYGSPGEESDIDLLVVKPDIGSRIEEYTKIRKSLKGIKSSFDIILLTSKEYEFYSLGWKNSVAAEAEEKGVILYAG